MTGPWRRLPAARPTRRPARFALALISLLALAACGKPGQLMRQWQQPLSDPRLTLRDLNGDGTVDFVLSGYAKAPRKDGTGQAVTDSVAALDGNNGKLLWGYQTGDHIAGYPALSGDTVYVGSSDRSLYALDTHNGYPRWRFATGGAIRGSAAVGGGLVYVGSRDHKLYALNAKTGKLVWQFSAGKPIDTTPALAGGRVYVGSWDRRLYALDAKTGKPIWSFTAQGPFASSSPVVSQGVVYIGSWDQTLYALDDATGRLRWKFDTSGLLEGSPVVAGGRVYIGSHDRRLYALNRKTGWLDWSYLSGDAIHSAPAVSELGVYFTSGDGHLYALNFAGRLRWKAPAGGEIRSTPALAGGTVLTGSPSGGLLRYYDPFSRVLWGMAGGEPEHHSLMSLAVKEGELLAHSQLSWGRERIWTLLPSKSN